VLRGVVFLELDFDGFLTLVLEEVALEEVVLEEVVLEEVVFEEVVFGETVLETAFDGAWVDLADGAMANIRGTGFLPGIAARTCLTALVCCSRVILNSWWPSLLATK